MAGSEKLWIESPLTLKAWFNDNLRLMWDCGKIKCCLHIIHQHNMIIISFDLFLICVGGSDGMVGGK
jgi:hypothetical protein